MDWSHSLAEHGVLGVLVNLGLVLDVFGAVSVPVSQPPHIRARARAHTQTHMVVRHKQGVQITGILSSPIGIYFYWSESLEEMRLPNPHFGPPAPVHCMAVGGGGS